MATTTTTTTTTAATAAATQTLTATHDPSYVPRGPVTASLHFYKPPSDGAKPFNYVEEPPAGVPQRNFSDTEYPVEINDIRGREADFTLDRHAFSALRDVPSAATRATFDSDAEVERVYYPEVERLLLEQTGAKRVLLFDHTIRRARPGATRAPVTRVHIDQTDESSRARVLHHLPEEADELLSRRYRIINVWRSINGPVQQHPLAFADSSSVPDDAMVGIEHRYPDRTGETAAVRKTDGMKWYYWSGVGEGERILLECFDSESGEDGARRRVPHTAFVDPRSPEGARERESIEVRALVFG
ncbi:MAG: hypothetical protein LQ342_001914 [Letrouitia transgressa]|nr:MAG: hypothetical protein LQ342_001914 [Letrouitia transgressa]